MTTPLKLALRLHTANATVGALLEGEVFDVILADYLIGAIDGFSPFTRKAASALEAAASTREFCSCTAVTAGDAASGARR